MKKVNLCDQKHLQEMHNTKPSMLFVSWSSLYAKLG